MFYRQSTYAIGTALGLWAVAVCAQTNDVPARAAAVQEAEAHRAQIQQIKEQLVTLATRAQQTHNPAQAECFQMRLVKLNGLLEVAQTALDRLRAAESDREWEEAALNIQFCALRAEKLKDEAMRCLEVATPPAVPPGTPRTNAPARPGKIRYEPRPAAPPARRVVRDRQTCLTQGQLACWVARAMELPATTADNHKACVDELTRRAIEPLEGWQPTQCATVDDLYVVAARVLNLPVDAPQDPFSYGQALREAGLAVDALLPARLPGAAPPVLVEDEVRAFLAAGYALPRK
jgi:hypothetical protein